MANLLTKRALSEFLVAGQPPGNELNRFAKDWTRGKTLKIQTRV